MRIYKQGDYIQVTSLYTIDSYLGLEIGDIICIEQDNPEGGGVLFITGNSMARSMQDHGLGEMDGMYALTYSQIEPVNSLIGEMFRKN